MIRATIELCGMIVRVEESNFKSCKWQKRGFSRPRRSSYDNISGCVSGLSPEVAFRAWLHIRWEIGLQKISLLVDDSQRP